MVEHFIIEDEYTINVKVQRDSNTCFSIAPLPITLSCYNPGELPEQNFSANSEKDKSPIFTFNCRNFNTTVHSPESFMSSTASKQFPDEFDKKDNVFVDEKISFMYSDDKMCTYINAKYDSDFKMEKFDSSEQKGKIANLHRPYRKSSDETTFPRFSCNKNSYNPKTDIPQFISGQLNDKMDDDRYKLPSVRIYSESDSLIAKNTFHAPPHFVRSCHASRSRSPCNSNDREIDRPCGPGTLFVKPIKKHCAKGNGELYVAPVHSTVFSKKNNEVIFKGNSKRNRNEKGYDRETLIETVRDPRPAGVTVFPRQIIDHEYNSAPAITPDIKNQFHYSPKSIPGMVNNNSRIGITSFSTINPPKYFRYQTEIFENDKSFTTSGNINFKNFPSEANFLNGKTCQYYPQRTFEESSDGVFGYEPKYNFEDESVPQKQHNVDEIPVDLKSSCVSKALLTEVEEGKMGPLSPKCKSDLISWSQGTCHRYSSKQESNQTRVKYHGFESCNGGSSDVKINKNITDLAHKSCKESPYNKIISGHQGHAMANEVIEKKNCYTFNAEQRNMKINSSISGERGPEVYTSVVPPSNNSNGCDVNTTAHLNLQAVLNHKKYSDYEVQRSNNMIVQEEPSQQAHFQNLPYNNNNLKELDKGLQFVSTRAKKYLPEEGSDELSGHANLGFDSCSVFGQENMAFESSFSYGSLGERNGVFDPGYGSERSEEDEVKSIFQSKTSYSSSSGENSPSRPTSAFYDLPDGTEMSVPYLMRIFPFINQSSLFEITIVKNSRGLGLAVTGGVECEDLAFPGLIRIRKLYPQTPAWLCGQLQLQDFILEANSRQITGLTSHEALEVLRTTAGEVNLVVCRPSKEVFQDTEVDSSNECNITSLTSPQPILGHHNRLSPSPSFSTYGEFEIELQKVSGSLGFTLKKNDNSILGHTIRSLVREPALSNGNMRAGDKLLSVNGTDMCGLSHEEAVHFLRTCPETVMIRLYRDAMQTPVSPASPIDPEFFLKPKQLRKEARDMLSDLAFRKQSSPNLSLLSSSPSTSRRRRLNKAQSPESKLGISDPWESLVRAAEADENTSPFDVSQADTLTASSSSRSGTIISRDSSGNSYKVLSGSTVSPANSPSSEFRPKRPNFLDLTGRYSFSRKSEFTPPHVDEEELPSPTEARAYDSLDSAPQLTSTHSDTPAFSHLQAGYRSINALNTDQRLTNTSSDHNLSSKNESPSNSALLKWKGVVFTPEEEEEVEEELQRLSSSPQLSTDRLNNFHESQQEPQVVTIEMARRWNSRLGFSLQTVAGRTAIVAIYTDSVAAKDGRLKIGDIVLEVNHTDVESWTTDDVIDLLRKTRGKISITVIQNPS